LTSRAGTFQIVRTGFLVQRRVTFMADNIRTLLAEQASVPIEVAAKALGLGRNSAYAAVRSGRLPSVRVGHKIAVPTAALRRLLLIEPEAVERPAAERSAAERPAPKRPTAKRKAA
jgi:excisionase family DNA binding protein